MDTQLNDLLQSKHTLCYNLPDGGTKHVTTFPPPHTALTSAFSKSPCTWESHLLASDSLACLPDFLCTWILAVNRCYVKTKIRGWAFGHLELRPRGTSYPRVNQVPGFNS